jgi:ABC-type polysaccharide/polyol phosphate export permease
VFLPLVLLIQIIFLTGISLFTSGLNVYYRDVKYIVEALLLIWFYLTPVFYPVSMVPGHLKKFYFLNPMAGIITFYRNLFLEGTFPDPVLLGLTAFFSLVIFGLGFLVFKKFEPSFADLI